MLCSVTLKAFTTIVIYNYYILAREAEIFYFLFFYLGKSFEGSKSKKKFVIGDIKVFFEEFDQALMRDLLAYDNIYFDSIGATIMNHMASVKEAFSGSPNFSSYQSSMAKLTDMCLLISDSVILNFR